MRPLTCSNVLARLVSSWTSTTARVVMFTNIEKKIPYEITN